MAVDYYDDAAGRMAPPLTGDNDQPAPARRLAASRRAVIAIAETLARRAKPWLAGALAAAVLLGGADLVTATNMSTRALALLWLAMVAVPGVVTLRRLNQFRIGVLLAGRPLTWRASHSAGLAVLSTALGCGALLLTTAPESAIAAAVVIPALTAIIAGLALGHLAAIRSALAAALPGMAFILLAIVLRQPGAVVSLGVPVAMTTTVLFGWIRYRQIAARMLEQHPRSETGHIAARRRRSTTAYNPFRIRQARAADTGRAPQRPRLYRPSEL